MKEFLSIFHQAWLNGKFAPSLSSKNCKSIVN
jgi:hypothetical protein